MYSGQSNLSIDAKGRVAIPARYRQSLLERCGGRLVVRGDLFQPCLVIHPRDHWETVLTRLQSQPQSDPRVAQIRRRMVGLAEEVELDKQGRIGLTPVLRAHLGGDKAAVLVGQIETFELWTPEGWAQQTGEESGDAVVITEADMAELGL